jgi:hypothetical protein
VLFAKATRCKLYQLALGKFRFARKNWLDFVGKRIAVEGKVETKKDVMHDSCRSSAGARTESRRAGGRKTWSVKRSRFDVEGISAASEQSLKSLKGTRCGSEFFGPLTACRVAPRCQRSCGGAE